MNKSRALSVLTAVDLDNHIWITAWNATWLDIVLQQNLDMQTVLSIDSSSIIQGIDFLDTGYDMINTHHSLPNSVFQDYEANNIPVNAYTVNTVFRYSQLLCLGVDSVTTNFPQLFIQLDAPIWCTSVEIYYSVWITSSILAIIIVLLKWQAIKRRC